MYRVRNREAFVTLLIGLGVILIMGVFAYAGGAGGSMGLVIAVLMIALPLVYCLLRMPYA